MVLDGLTTHFFSFNFLKAHLGINVEKDKTERVRDPDQDLSPGLIGANGKPRSKKSN